MWEDQRIVSRPRYRDLISGLQFVARQELIFGIHVHVGLDDPDKAIHVTNGMRVHLPLLLALSANSPFWRAQRTGPALHPHADLPRLPARGHPAALRRLGGLGAADRLHDASKTINDYTYLWYDVRPHPNFGTVEVRVMDSQTRLEHTLGLAAMVQAMVKELAEHFDAGQELSRYPYEMLDENKWLAARHGLEGELVDLPEPRPRAHQGPRPPPDRPPPRPREDLGSADALEAVEDLLENGNGGARQIVVFEANHDLREVVGEIVERRCRAYPAPRLTGAAGRRHAAGTLRAVSQPDLFVVCKNCGSEVSPYVTECPYCGQRVRKRAPKLERGEDAEPRRKQRRRPRLSRAARRRDRGDRPRHAAHGHARR